MVNRKISRLGGISLVVAAAIALAACSSQGASPKPSGGTATLIPIGSSLELTGPSASTGIPWSRGVALGVKEANGSNGFLVAGKRYKWDLTQKDDQTDPNQAIAQFREFAGNGTKFIFGPSNSSAFKPAFNALGSAPALVMTASSIANTLTPQANQALFVTLANGEAAFNATYAKAVIAKDHPKSVAILLPDDVIGPVFVAQYTKVFQEEGVKVVLSKTFPPATTNFAPYINDLKSAKPDMVLTGYLDQWLQPLMQQSVQAGFTSANWMNTVGTTEPTIAKTAGAIKKVYFPIPVKSVTDTSDAQTKTFRALWKSTYGSAPVFNDFNALAYYDPILMLTKAMEKAKTVTDVAKIAKELPTVTSWPGQASNGSFSTTDHTRLYPVNYGVYGSGKVNYFQVPLEK